MMNIYRPEILLIHMCIDYPLSRKAKQNYKQLHTHIDNDDVRLTITCQQSGHGRLGASPAPPAGALEQYFAAAIDGSGLLAEH